MTYDPRKHANPSGSPNIRTIGSAGKYGASLNSNTSIFDERKDSGRGHPKFQVRNTNEVGRRLLDKRLSYIPDLKKRQRMSIVAEVNQTPEQFLYEYAQRKKIRDQPDIVDRNKNLNVELEAL